MKKCSLAYENGDIVKKAKLCSKTALPAPYRVVEYIQSSGTQWINTGINPSSNNLKVETRATFTGYPTPDGSLFLFGSANTGGTYRWFSFFFSRAEGYPLTCQYSKNGSAQGYTFKSSIDCEVTMSINNGNLYCKCNGAILTDTCDNYSPNLNEIFIFARNDSGSPVLFSKAKLYYFKMYNNDILVRNFVPCYNTQTEVIGMYDTVNNNFYTNSGTGTFVKGPNKMTFSSLVLPD